MEVKSLDMNDPTGLRQTMTEIMELARNKKIKTLTLAYEEDDSKSAGKLGSLTWYNTGDHCRINLIIDVIKQEVLAQYPFGEPLAIYEKALDDE